jgi:hypothetical protein
VPDESEFLCGDWVWDAALGEMRHYPRRKKAHAETPDAVERLDPAKRVVLHLWSQQPMQTATGQVMSASQGRVVVEYTDGRKLDINEDDRACARKIGETIAAAYGLPLEEEGAPSGRRGGNLPQRDEMGRLHARDGRVETVLDEVGGLFEVVRSKRPFGKERRSLRTNEIRRLELTQAVNGPYETFTVQAIVGPEEEALPVASYTGLEGWADPGEWRDFTRDLAARLHVEARV